MAATLNTLPAPQQAGPSKKPLKQPTCARGHVKNK